MPNSLQTPEPLQDGDLLAAIDLGSNSFHMVIARYLLGQLRVVDRLRETVRMADGLDGKGGISADAQQRALDCLARFGQRIRDLPNVRVRALATNTVRKLRQPRAFLDPAEAALGHAIEHALSFSDNYGLGIPNFLYNVKPGQFDRVLICSETPEQAAPAELVAALNAEVIFDGH